MEVLKIIAIVSAVYILYKIITSIKANEKENLLEYTINNVVNFVSLNNMYKIVVILLFVVFVLIITHLFTSTYENFIKLLAPLGIILSASIASLSVLKSIENTNRIEEEKKESDKHKLKEKLELYIRLLIQINFDNLIIDQKGNRKHAEEIHDIYELFLKDKDLLAFINSDVGSKFLYSIKTLAKCTSSQVVGKDNESISKDFAIKIYLLTESKKNINKFIDEYKLNLSKYDFEKTKEKINNKLNKHSIV